MKISSNIASCRKKIAEVFVSPVKTLITLSAILVVIIFFITACWGWVSDTVFPNTKLGLYDKSFWENFLVEMHGIVFELSIVGVLIIWLDSKRSKSNDIARLREDLDDFSTLDFPEINVKKLGHIKRLNAHKIKDIDVQNLILNHLKVKGVSIEGTRLIGLKIIEGSVINCLFNSVKMRSSNFQGSTLKGTSFIKCDLLKNDFTNTICKGVNFSGSCLERANFTNSNLQSATFRGCDVRFINFEGANLKQSSFKDAVNLTAEILVKAENIDHIKVPIEIMNELIKLRPDMKQYEIQAGN